MPKHALCLFVVLAAAVAPPLSAQESDQAERMRRGEYLLSTFREFELVRAETPEQPLAHHEKPLLRYSNPIRNFFSDGCSLLWLDGNRPAAVATISIRGEGHVWWEFTSLSGSRLLCTRDGQPQWKPQSGNLIGKTLPDGPPPAAEERLRLIQFRQMARRFGVTQHHLKSGEDNTMRLLDQPIYHWSSTENGPLAGALFAFCETTDPETILMLEVVQPDGIGKAHWRYSLARMTSHPLTFTLDDQPIAELKGYWRNPRSPDDPYSARRLGMYQTASDE